MLLLTSSYTGQEFIRVGYYVNNDYGDEQLRGKPPPVVLIDRVQRNILAYKPWVTKFPINFHPETSDNGEQHPKYHLLSDHILIILLQQQNQIPQRNMRFLVKTNISTHLIFRSEWNCIVGGHIFCAIARFRSISRTD